MLADMVYTCTIEIREILVDRPGQILVEIVDTFLSLKAVVRAVLEDGYEARQGVVIGVCATVNDPASLSIISPLKLVFKMLGVGCTAIIGCTSWRRSYFSNLA